jgi:hypothetical protein
MVETLEFQSGATTMSKSEVLNELSQQTGVPREVLNNLAQQTGLSRQEVQSVLDALTNEIGKVQGKKGNGVFRSVAELLPSIQALPRADKLRLIAQLADDLAHEEHATDEVVLRPEDQCPYAPDELVRMRREIGGRPLAEIWHRLGQS